MCIDKTKKIMIDRDEYEYTGEMDQEGRACGDGLAKGWCTFEGTFTEDFPIICKCLLLGS